MSQDDEQEDVDLDKLSKEVLDECVEYGLIRIDSKNRLHITELGKKITEWRDYIDKKKLN